MLFCFPFPYNIIDFFKFRGIFAIPHFKKKGVPFPDDKYDIKMWEYERNEKELFLNLGSTGS